MRVLYLGLTPPPSTSEREIVHFPVIHIAPVSPDDPTIRKALAALKTYTHLLLTSKNAVRLLCEICPCDQLKHLRVVAVGTATAREAERYALKVSAIAETETAEGVVAILENENLTKAHAFWPRAAGARTVIIDFFKKHQVPLTDCIFYHTELTKPSNAPELDNIDEIVFTSPSTVDGFLALYGTLPTNKKLSAIGPITQKHLTKP